MSSAETEVRKSIVVDLPVGRAFELFTARFDLWWPRSHHIGKVEPFTAILEPREGGRWYERGADGSECDWGRVLAYSPPKHVAMSWHLNPGFGYDPDPARASRVDVSFYDEGRRTRVELVHSQLDRHGPDWKKLRDSVGSQGGWPGILAEFAASAVRVP
ncbi:MAG TPA: SRPBCC family protein [Myxococcota bacterium]|nr:SRPBCC family protein [Myxococcota bacterium]